MYNAQELKKKKISPRTKKFLENRLEYIQQLSNTLIEFHEDETVLIDGENRYVIEQMIESFQKLNTHSEISHDEIKAMYHMIKRTYRYTEQPDNIIQLPGIGKKIHARSRTQVEYVKLMQKYDITFASGPAGTGKTHIAAALGLNALITRDVKKMILSRPIVQAGELLGFLPGDIKDKLDPYLRPLYDELLVWIDQLMLDKYISQGLIEIAPLAFMRGRTFTNSWIILDEAQNTTIEQMKMFLTRLGPGSKMVITGDQSQIDLHPKVTSGFKDALHRLKDLQGIGFAHFSEDEIVRHPILQSIIDEYKK